MALLPVLAAAPLASVCGFKACGGGCGLVGVCVASGLAEVIVLIGAAMGAGWKSWAVQVVGVVLGCISALALLPSGVATLQYRCACALLALTVLIYRPPDEPADGNKTGMLLPGVAWGRKAA